VKLINNKKLQQINNKIAVQQLFSFVDLSFKPSLNEGKIIFYSKKFCLSLWKLMNKYLHQHLLILTANRQFFSLASIWKLAIEEIYNFCK